ncbi:gas vesicle protein GvpJ [Nonomuraea lactucae]|uniref:gas vesicle protein GvpJ n=1 Tax=Nonomuraea lactucae TaxID=2249762 RepID=UPI000DE36DB7|nr:gas vesicle protein GvpJ [Nonomuraea lactucae]
MTVQPATGGVAERPSASGLADVIDTILDKGLVVDAYVRVSLVGIELLTIDARIVVASVDTYLRFAEAVNRLDLAEAGNQQGLPEIMENVTKSGAAGKSKGAAQGVLEAAGEKLQEFVGDMSEDSKRGSARGRRRGED